MRLLTARRVAFRGSVLVTGDLQPDRSAQLAFAAAGRLRRIEVRRGQAVRAGQLLASLDPALARAQAAQAEAGVAAAEAQLRLAEDGLRRAQTLHTDKGIPGAQLFQAEAQRDLAAAQLRGARAQREQAAVNLGYHSLHAPFAGVVTKLPPGTGLTVAPGMPLFFLEATDPLVLETTVGPAEARSIARGTAVRVTVPASGQSTTAAIIRTIVPAAEPVTHRVPVEIEVANPGGALLPHTFARAEIPVSGERAALEVPAGALVQREGRFSIWVAGPGMKARAIRVRVLGQQAEAAQVEVETDTVAQPGGGSDAQGGALLGGVAVQVVDLPPPDLAEGTRLLGTVAAPVHEPAREPSPAPGPAADPSSGSGAAASQRPTSGR